MVSPSAMVWANKTEERTRQRRAKFIGAWKADIPSGYELTCLKGHGEVGAKVWDLARYRDKNYKLRGPFVLNPEDGK